MENETAATPDIPDKLFFKIGEVSDIAGVPAYVLRFWESEFKKVRPKRTESGQRLYRKNDIELILKIKHLLYDKKFTIQGAKRHLRIKNDAPQRPTKSIDVDELRAELLYIRNLLG